MKVNIFGSAEHHEIIEIDTSADELEFAGLEDVEFDEPVHIALNVSRTTNTAYVKGTVETSVRLECARCLEMFLWRMTSDFTLVVKQLRDGEHLRDAEPEDDEAASMVMLASGESDIDIAPYIRDAMVLAFPMKPVCRDDCQGLCPVCGRNINAGPCGCAESHQDVRWRTLEGLFGEGGGKER